ncbi:S-methyl-5-thioribose-1-phosphate isomerase [Deferribacter autotrophicus]|uniref:Methylthioribose-1-phosphate isomerase n=1 Tax=Deferribacter autotrophicus TaxID=500465 RepID=A0A5A8F8I5_9BACT|nr:S-methyl-5-thioribose-1-phosphate isomerase [Deferribacter autotrophicus]KAA0258881.1 S-methyl-5-thioribose-1-phosphate isomerase [Deferribacter autotrophicus]
MLEPIIWEKDNLKLLDQRVLPHKKEYMVCKTVNDVAFAIKEMVVRGAPAIGVSAAFGVVLGLKEGKSINEIYELLKNTRPTAVNLIWALDKMKGAYEYCDGDINYIEKVAIKLFERDIEYNRMIGKNGVTVLNDGDNILTHCNAGALATAGYGTALGVFKAAKEAGLNIHVYVDETRPYLQGARLTAFELMEEDIPCTLICDNMPGFLMSQKKIDKIIVGADRIAKNGDTANKIGTYQLAVLAYYHDIPFYIAAPLSTFDFTIEDGSQIKIEMRNGDEIRKIKDIFISPKNVPVYNPAFDVTPSHLITGYITEFGVFSSVNELLNKINEGGENGN